MERPSEYMTIALLISFACSLLAGCEEQKDELPPKASVKDTIPNDIGSIPVNGAVTITEGAAQTFVINVNDMRPQAYTWEDRAFNR